MKTLETRKSLFRNTLVAAALAVGLGATGALHADTGNAADALPRSDSAGAAIGDTVITAKVKTAFLGERRLRTAAIAVTTTNGVVTLTGTVDDPESRSLAVRLARGVDGVRNVDGEDLGIPAAAGSTSPAVHALAKRTKTVISDSVITAKVKSEILADSVSKGFEVSVSTKHGVVVLSGNVANPEGIDRVKDIAGKVDGVKSVDASGLISRGG